jgi:hypothetical protein
MQSTEFADRLNIRGGPKDDSKDFILTGKMK